MVYSIRHSSTTKFVQMMIPAARLTFDLFTQRLGLVHDAFVWENTSVVDYSETIEVFDIKLVAIYIVN